MRIIGSTLGAMHIAILLGTTATHGAIPLSLWTLCGAEATLIAITFFVRGTKWTVDLLFVALCAAFGALSLARLGFTVGVGSWFVVLCVGGAAFHGQRGGIVTWGLSAAILFGYCAWLAITGTPAEGPYGTVIVPAPLALRFSIAVLALSGVATFIVTAVLRAMETTARQLSTVLARERAARSAHAATERTLARERQLKSTGRLAAQIAHDLNNVLTPIVAHATWLKDDPSIAKKPETEEAVNAIAVAAERAVTLTRELQAFSPKGTQARRPIGIDTLVNATATALSMTSTGSVRVKTKLGAPKATILADEVLLRSIVSHLGVNARESMPGGGEVQIATALVELPFTDAPECTEGLPPGPYVELTVADAGTGISTEVAERIYEPFFSTKAEGRGLGLASVYGAVQNHHGAIGFTSTPTGTTFKVYLPVNVSVPSSGSLRAASTTKRALVVDDEASVRQVIVRILRRSGYECLEATNGREGLEILGREHADLALVVLDSAMPEMLGEEVLTHLRALNRSLPVLMVSGHVASASADELARDPHLAFLAKPFAPTDLTASVDRLLKS